MPTEAPPLRDVARASDTHITLGGACTTNPVQRRQCVLQPKCADVLKLFPKRSKRKAEAIVTDAQRDYGDIEERIQKLNKHGA